MKNTYRLSDDLSIDQVENLYREVVLKQDFYNDDYGTNWSLPPYKDMARILVNTVNPKRHLDIGCGEGLLVCAMRAQGIDSRGIDFSEALIKRADSSILKHLQVVSVEDWLQKGSIEEVDLVSYMEVFEHLPIRVLQDILTSIGERLNGYLFLTIPSYGVDTTFRRGIIVNDGTPQWKRDMERNIPLRNIVLENERPHLGHITLASYRWWTEFFISMGFGRHYDLERIISIQFGDVLGCYHWNPFVLKQLTNNQSNLIRNSQHLVRGWHSFEAEAYGRWTDGYAQTIITGDQPKFVELEISLPSINVIQDFPIWLIFEFLVANEELQFNWQPVLYPMPVLCKPREQKTKMIIELKNNHMDYENNQLRYWRVSLISPHWSPYDYGLSGDKRQLSIFVHRLEVIR